MRAISSLEKPSRMAVSTPRGDVHGVKLQHFFYVQRGKRLRRVQAAVRRDALQDGFPGGRARAAPRVL